MLRYALSRWTENGWGRPSGAPEGETAAEVFQPSDNPKLPKKLAVVHYPSMYVFLPPKGKAKGTGVVIAPGGGHSHRTFRQKCTSMRAEGTGLACEARRCRRNLARPPETLDDRPQTNGPIAPISLVDARAGYSTRRDQMKTRQLGNSGLQVSPLVLGGNVFGWTVDEPTSFKLLDALWMRG